MRYVLHFSCVFALYLIEVQQDVVGSLFRELFGFALEGGGEGRRGSEGALFGELRHFSLELEKEG